jgi:hypothetical protein
VSTDFSAEEMVDALAMLQADIRLKVDDARRLEQEILTKGLTGPIVGEYFVADVCRDPRKTVAYLRVRRRV